MPRREQERMHATESSSPFAVGDRVRIKRGVKDHDYPDLPIGGWAAIITEVGEDGTYTLSWTEDTLKTIHPIYRKRCERDGGDFDIYCIGGEDLESDPGGPLEIERPDAIITRPLSEENQDDRVRFALGLTADDALPDVDEDTLLAYREFLAVRLSFPFQAVFNPERGVAASVEVLGLGEADGEPMVDDDYGIMCEVRLRGRTGNVPLAELEKPEAVSNRQWVDDYS
jgi:hypothetical protein